MKNNRRIIHVLILMSLLFLSLLGYLTYFEIFYQDKIVTNSYNRRQWAQEENTLRGTIFDRNGNVLAQSTTDGKRQERVYPYANLYSQVIGYNSRSYGKSLLESAYNKYLLNISQFNPVISIKEKLSGAQKVGDNLYLTIDHPLQAKAEKLLDGRSGAIVVMDPKTGEVLAMVSKPDYDPNSSKLSDNWQGLVESQSHPFLPRATQGLYIPGSTFKVVTAAAALENGMEGRTFNDSGSIVIDGKKINNFGGEVFGQLDLKGALTVSCNTVFSQIGTALGEKTLREISGRIGMEKEIPFDIPVTESRFPYKNMSETDTAAVGMGQGKILVTPLHMAMIASGIANNGQMMRPILVSKVVSPDNKTVKAQNSSLLYSIMTPETAGKLKAMMQSVVDNGTGKRAAIGGIHVGGKTGTAENELSGRQRNKEHAWFIGFAPVENPRVAVAVLLEYSGSTGGTVAAPIAGQLMEAWLKK